MPQTVNQHVRLYGDYRQGLKREKISAGMVALPSFPSCPQAIAILAKINANISDQLPESHKMVCKANRYDFSQKRIAGMLSRQPGKCQHARPVHTVPLQALILQQMLSCALENYSQKSGASSFIWQIHQTKYLVLKMATVWITDRCNCILCYLHAAAVQSLGCRVTDFLFGTKSWKQLSTTCKNWRCAW